jgi:hypothetical protein
VLWHLDSIASHWYWFVHSALNSAF